MYQLAARLVLGTVALMSSNAPDPVDQAVDSRIVAALVPIIDAAKLDSRTRVVVDRTQLVRTTRLSATSIASLARRVAHGITIGTAAHLNRCRGQAGRFCSVVRIDELTDLGDSIVVRAGWSPLIGCGSYDAVFTVSLRRGRVAGVTRDDEDHGDCGQAAMSQRAVTQFSLQTLMSCAIGFAPARKSSTGNMIDTSSPCEIFLGSCAEIGDVDGSCTNVFFRNKPVFQKMPTTMRSRIPVFTTLNFTNSGCSACPEPQATML